MTGRDDVRKQSLFLGVLAFVEPNPDEPHPPAPFPMGRGRDPSFAEGGLRVTVEWGAAPPSYNPCFVGESLRGTNVPLRRPVSITKVAQNLRSK
jgi:hypothetical protein